MAEKKSRAAARKIKDKWKAKVWYNLLAPEMFNKQLLGETPTDTPDKLVGRVTEVTVQDLTGDFSKMHIKLAFRVSQVAGQDALTQFVGHDMTSDYIRRLTRRKRTRTDLTVDVVTKDGWNVRVKPMAITDRRIQSSKQRVIRTIMTKLVADVAAKQSIGEFVKGIISADRGGCDRRAEGRGSRSGADFNGTRTRRGTRAGSARARPGGARAGRASSRG
jgi:small subunit ribosomal protein S3Ae